MRQYFLKSLLDDMEVAIKGEEYYYFTTSELWEWLLFEDENMYLNEELTIHEPSGFPIKGRSSVLKNDVKIVGDFLLFTHIGHVPSYHLKALNNLEEVVNEIIGGAGIFNSFTSIQIAIIEGAVFGGFETLEEPFIKIGSNEELLSKSILELCSLGSTMSFENFVNEGRQKILFYKNKGGEQQIAYDLIHVIKRTYRILEVDLFDDKLDELLDYICGYIGNKKMWIWENRL